jgi:hypothetical protein
MRAFFLRAAILVGMPLHRELPVSLFDCFIVSSLFNV